MKDRPTKLDWILVALLPMMIGLFLLRVVWTVAMVLLRLCVGLLILMLLMIVWILWHLTKGALLLGVIIQGFVRERIGN
jgi:hypothetical protein